MYRVETPLLSSVDIVSVKKKNLSCLVMTIGRQSQRTVKRITDEERVKVKAKILAKVKDVIDTRPADSGAV